MTYTCTQEKILSTAESLIQSKGFNAFSYKDIANIIGIKTSSIHYHYATKEDLAVAVVDWQLYRLSTTLDNLANNKRLSAKGKILKFIELIISITYKDDMKMCLGGMFASDILSVSEDIRSKVQSFFNSLQQWIEAILVAGMHNSDKSKKPVHFSRRLIMQLEGGLLLARLYQDDSYLAEIKRFVDEHEV